MGESIPPLRLSVHQALGGGSVADVVLWKRWGASVVVLTSATALWFLFERAGYNLLSFVANVLFLLVVILFLWAKSARLLNRLFLGVRSWFDGPLPPLPDMEISEETIAQAASVIQVYTNHVLTVLRDIVVGRNVKVFLQVAFGLWAVSLVGSTFNFLTLVYIGVLLSLSLPFLYDKFQHPIDEKLVVAHRVIHSQYRKLDDTIIKKILLPPNKEKKTQ
ncbi:hypothetical protein Tsubulata_015606 [Turnera subulata]|uniref:Reticulon-like protein n=1 Tax=Turnera subulata TaxID=218843 RepID=A0A9Q0J7B6_9ROSI|nr:hypothetical protein Tsubulata_015606 [Turnera subulata]